MNEGNDYTRLINGLTFGYAENSEEHFYFFKCMYPYILEQMDASFSTNGGKLLDCASGGGGIGLIILV